MSKPNSHPDADLHPTATGLAAKTVEAHAADAPLRLYSGWFCPFVQRVWLVLQEKQIPYQYIEVNPYNKPESLLRLNPRGLVPTLEFEGKPLYESNVVCEFLEDAYPGAGGVSLLPPTPYERARVRIWSDFCTSRVIPGFHRFLQWDGDEKGLSGVRDEFLGYLKTFAREMDGKGPYFLGREPCLIDFVVVPWAVRLWVFDHFKGGLGIPEEGKGGDDEKAWARWRRWVSAMEGRRSVQETTSDREHYLPIYARYANNTAQSELAKATRQGRGVP